MGNNDYFLNSKQELTKNNPYVIPEGCFEKLALCIQDKISERKQHTFMRELPGRVAVGLSVFLLALTGYIGFGSVFSKPLSNSTNNEYLSSVPRTIQSFPDKDDQ